MLPPHEGLDGWFELFDAEKGEKHYKMVEIDKKKKNIMVALHNNMPRTFFRQGLV